MSARILVVDDVAANTRLLEAKLTAEYYEVATAQTGFAALHVAGEWQPDLILLDVMMPGLDGYETCRRLKGDARTVHIPVVMVTALGEPEERIRGLESGADDFMTKPVEYLTLMARIRSLVRLKRLLDEWRARGETAQALGLGGDKVALPPVTGARALVVDDWDQGAQLVQNALAREGILTGRAASETEAMALTAAIPFDLIVISVSMTGGDGLRLASRLRAGDSTHDVPLLLIADPEERGRILRGFDIGANDWVQRPVEENELRVRARNQVRRKFYQDRLRADLGHALEMALTDPLTGLYNQRYMMQHLRGLADSSPPGALALLMVDVDHFKDVNDRWGHAAGDRALRIVAETLRSCVRVFDSIARYGGEEFVVIMPGAGAEDARLTAERLRAAVEGQSFSPQAGYVHRLSVSVGVAVRERPDMTAEQMLVAADQAMYIAKRRGRNRVEFAVTDGTQTVDMPVP
jgi:two-component system cell cycle response regulator